MRIRADRRGGQRCRRTATSTAATTSGDPIQGHGALELGHCVVASASLTFSVVVAKRTQRYIQTVITREHPLTNRQTMGGGGWEDNSGADIC